MGDSDSALQSRACVTMVRTLHYEDFQESDKANQKPPTASKVQGSVMSNLCSLLLYKFRLQSEKTWSLPCVEGNPSPWIEGQRKENGRKKTNLEGLLFSQITLSIVTGNLQLIDCMGTHSHKISHRMEQRANEKPQHFSTASSSTEVCGGTLVYLCFLPYSLCSALSVVGYPLSKCWLQRATFFWVAMNRIR